MMNEKKIRKMWGIVLKVYDMCSEECSYARTSVLNSDRFSDDEYAKAAYQLAFTIQSVFEQMLGEPTDSRSNLPDVKNMVHFMQETIYFINRELFALQAQALLEGATSNEYAKMYVLKKFKREMSRLQKMNFVF